MKARQDTNMEAAQGGLDHHWVTRWLDDVGLPQYKDTFFEARVDGRVLNVLTVEDLLVHMKITNLLHHLSIRRGIQVSIFFDREFFLRGLRRTYQAWIDHYLSALHAICVL